MTVLLEKTLGRWEDVDETHLAPLAEDESLFRHPAYVERIQPCLKKNLETTSS